LIGWHAPFAHIPPQHALFVVQGPLSPTQLVAQTPPLQLSEQQSVPDAHAPPGAMHFPIVEPHVPVAESHVPEQHWLPLWHIVPAAPHVGPTLASPPVPGPPVDGPLFEPPQAAANTSTAHNHDGRRIILESPGIAKFGFRSLRVSTVIRECKREATRSIACRS
jgi:hypothetical protein